MQHPGSSSPETTSGVGPAHVNAGTADSLAESPSSANHHLGNAEKQGTTEDVATQPTKRRRIIAADEDRSAAVSVVLGPDRTWQVGGPTPGAAAVLTAAGQHRSEDHSCAAQL